MMAKAYACFGRLRQILWNNHHVFMRVKGKIYRAVHPLMRSQGQDSVQTTGEKSVCFHDAISAFDHKHNLDGQSDKQGHSRTDTAAIYGRSEKISRLDTL